MVERLVKTNDEQLSDATPPLESLVDGPPISFARRFRAFGSGLSARHVPLSMIDQTIVSGSSFLTTLLIGRISGAEELGIYSLAFTLIVLVSNLQTAVLSTPYTIYANRMSGSVRREYAGSVLIHCLMLMAGLSFSMALLAVGLRILQPLIQYTEVIWILACAMPLFLLREFIRRFAFAHLRITVVIVLDSVVATIQLFGLWLLVRYGMLTTVNVYILMGVACAIACAGTLAFLKEGIAFRLKSVLPELRKSWLLGRWIAATRMAALVQVYSIHWILAAFLGAAATGSYAASMTLLLAANPFVIGIGNVLEPRAAQALAEGGVQKLQSVVWSATKLIGIVMGFYCGLLVFTGGWIVSFLYNGSQYEGLGPTVAILSLATLVNAWETGAIHGLRVLERADLSFRASLVALSLTLAFAILLVQPFGTLGGALAILVGDTVAATMRWFAFSRISKQLCRF